LYPSDWLKRFRDVHEDLEDYPRIGWLSSAQNPETIADIWALVARDH
jgi:5'-deoxynucleotidase YfbR-like HD superfamily hydrolase